MIQFPLRKLLVFQLLSLADLFLTCHLLQQGRGQVYESNPLAHACFACYGWAGLVLFKAASVLLVGGLSVFIWLHRPRAGARLLLFACSVLAGVVLYSCSLSLSVGWSDPGDAISVAVRRLADH